MASSVLPVLTGEGKSLTCHKDHSGPLAAGRPPHPMKGIRRGSNNYVSQLWWERCSAS